MSRNFNGTTSTIGIIGASGGQAFSWSFNTPQPLSVCAWIKPINLGESSSGQVVSCQAAGGSGTGFWAFRLRAPSTFEMIFDYTNPGNKSARAAGGTIDTSGVWQHVSSTWTGGVASDTANLILYWNANTVAYLERLTSGGVFNSNTDKSLVIGNNGNATLTFNGDIAHVHIFRKVLSQGEIMHLMGHPGSVVNTGSISSVGTTGLLGYWPLGGFMGPNSPDFSGNARVGTITAVVSGSNEPPVNEQFVIGYPQGALAM